MWREVPIAYVIMEKVRRLNAPIVEDDLYKEVKNSVKYEVPYKDFLKALMSLEIRGMISVSLIKEDTRMITYLGDFESE
ncbi:hypothetical protein [Sulfuracidifex metallicus]|jgi:hypothetical protein|uniref:DNA-binding protein n=1 Tax=Sulfuracidifex metallicus DSM 6482 = JCM 9184 TaxID=523847 RepID=A0A6A9QLX6_SULME|nr:hypothetical protein [Sulfuracidifex metallicus]MCY0849286.1 hypothetical protein [Sulfuracidifex metallicus]MUN28708.1 hypothetical protein [Sulfuracidifex metallicus DSM 6482 = JCM 9184]WOE50770.1 hypothetical protein RQ359_002342 [Sulfuracidifex metallicus DSM 6482 = JCM 9184]